MTAIEIAWTWLNSNVVAVTSIVGTVTAIATIVLIAATIITGKRVAAQTAATTRATDVVVAENMAAYQARMMDDAVNLRGVRKNVAIWNLVELAEERGAGRRRAEIVAFFREQATHEQRGPDEIGYGAFLETWDRHGVGPEEPLQFDLRTKRGEDVGLWSLLKQAFGLWRQQGGPKPRVLTEDFRKAVEGADIWLHEAGLAIRAAGHDVIGPNVTISVHAGNELSMHPLGSGFDWGNLPRRLQRGIWISHLAAAKDMALQMTLMGEFTGEPLNGEWQVRLTVGKAGDHWSWRNDGARWLPRDEIAGEVEAAVRAGVERLAPARDAT